MRTLTRWLAPCAAAALAIGIGFAAAQSAAPAGEDEPDRSAAADAATEGSAVPDDSPVRGLPDDFDITQFDPATATSLDEIDRSFLERGTVSLADCPEALQFFERPEVEQFLQDRFGDVPDEHDRWANGCPSVPILVRSYENAQTLFRVGETK